MLALLAASLPVGAGAAGERLARTEARHTTGQNGSVPNLWRWRQFIIAVEPTRRDPRRWKAFRKLRCTDVPSENNLKNNGHACPGRNYH